MQIVEEQQLSEQPLSLEEARMLLLNVSRPTLRKWIREGIIRSHRIGRRYFFFQSELLTDLKTVKPTENDR